MFLTLIVAASAKPQVIYQLLYVTRLLVDIKTKKYSRTLTSADVPVRKSISQCAALTASPTTIPARPTAPECLPTVTENAPAKHT